MLGSQFLVVLTLISPPPRGLESLRAAPLYTTVRTTCQDMAVRSEILDPREVRYILARPEDFFADLNLD